MFVLKARMRAPKQCARSYNFLVHTSDTSGLHKICSKIRTTTAIISLATGTEPGNSNLASNYLVIFKTKIHAFLTTEFIVLQIAKFIFLETLSCSAFSLFFGRRENSSGEGSAPVLITINRFHNIVSNFVRSLNYWLLSSKISNA